MFRCLSLYTGDGPRHKEPQQLVLLQHDKHILSLPELGKAEHKYQDLENTDMKGAHKAELCWGVQAADFTLVAFSQTHTLVRSKQPPVCKHESATCPQVQEGTEVVMS